MVKIVVSDLDGTLLNEHHSISSFTAETVDNLVTNGTKFVVATGRHRKDVVPMIDGLQSSFFTITSNGARVHDADGRLFFSENLRTDIVHSIIDLGRKYQVHINVYKGDSWLVEQPNASLACMHDTSKFFYEQVDLADIEPTEVAKIFFIGERAVLDQLNAELESLYDGDIGLTFSLDNTLELMAKGVSKGKALQLVLDHKSLNASQAMGFGDGMNDLEMLKLVDHPVLMENAHDDLKLAVENHNLAQSNRADGVAHYLNQYFS